MYVIVPFKYDRNLIIIQFALNSLIRRTIVLVFQSLLKSHEFEL